MPEKIRKKKGRRCGICREPFLVQDGIRYCSEQCPETAKPVVVKKKAKKRISISKDSWLCCGFDVSMSSIAGAAIGYDGTLRKMVGPVTTIKRWTKEDDYYKRMVEASKAADFIHDLQRQLKTVVESECIYIAIEEPWAFGQVKSGFSNALKQQAQISGSFMGGLLRYGYLNLFEINNQSWRKLVADDLSEFLGEDITTHYTKWKDPKLCKRFHTAPTNTGKFRAKQWVEDIKNPRDGWNIPDFTDLISTSKDGLIPRPDTSKAMAVQSDDRYEALPMMEWMVREMKRGE